jgi:glycosyltransferase involved in cell wall biosynthesis
MIQKNPRNHKHVLVWRVLFARLGKEQGAGQPTMNPTVSAIITTYNYERFIAAAIESVLGQTRPPDEVVVVDDGSTDGTAAIVARYAARGVRYVYRANGGAGAARNTGLRETRGTLVTFLDADDRWLPDKLARQLAHLARYPTAGLVTGSEWQVYESGDPPLFLHRTPVGAARFYPGILVENMIGNPSLTLVRRACFDRVGLFDETMPLGQDWDMWIRIARECPVGVVGAPLIEFRRHNTSMTAGQFWGRITSNRALYRRHIRQVRSLPARLNLWRAAESMSNYYSAAWLAEQSEQQGLARRMALAAAVLDPFYETKLKLGLLFRVWFGRAAFDRLRRFLPRGAGGH